MEQLLYKALPLLFLLFSSVIFGQEIEANKGSYGIDEANKIIVWHVAELDSVLLENKTISSIKFDASFIISDTDKPLSYSEANKVTKVDSYVLYISKLPLVHITLDDSTINSENKIAGSFTYFNDDTYLKSSIGIRHRGNLSLSFSKKSFDLEFWTDSISKEKKDVKFNGLRSDDDWILDAMFNEPLRLRSYVSTKLWLTIHQPYYLEKEPEAKSGFGVKFVDVFKNNHYYGVYQFSESIDRKQLKLKKNVDKSINGELYKANSYHGGPDFTKAPKYRSIFPHWAGFRIEYPFIDYEADWQHLSKFVNLVVNGTDTAFINGIEREVKLSNVIDYYLFINTVRATDNLGKNYYLAKYNKNEPYFFVAWDLDGVMGIIQVGKREAISKDILGNGLFNRLIKLNPNGYNANLKARWLDLRSNAFSNEELLSKIDEVYTKFTEEKIYEREQLIWKNTLNDISNEAHYKYLTSWLNERMTNLDAYFMSL